jgi:superfamily I DNA and/or RNA helicase
VNSWIEQHLHLRHLGRTVWLEKQYRMTPALANVIGDLLGGDGPGDALGSEVSPEAIVQFVPVISGAKSKNTGRGPRKPESAAEGRLPSLGAGLETDLAALRPGDRVPEEIRSLLPAKGFVNLPEARAVVRKLEEMMPAVAGQLAKNPKSAAVPVAVIALYPAQADLIRHLIRYSPHLAPHASAIAIGPPSAFRQHEADVVVISLTRSHNHRAVGYGEGPAALELALTRAHRRVVLVGDPGNLMRRSQWRGALDHLDEAAGNREAWLLGQIVRYLQGRGRYQTAFRFG